MNPIFGVIFTIQGHWEALESKITKIQNYFYVSIDILPRRNQPQGTHFWGHFHDSRSLGGARELETYFLRRILTKDTGFEPQFNSLVLKIQAKRSGSRQIIRQDEALDISFSKISFKVI